MVKFLCLFLGFLSLVIYPAGGANLKTATDVKEQFEIIIDNNALSFPKATIGKISEEKKITTLVKGDALYQIYIQATSLKADDKKELPPSVIEFKEKSEPHWLSASNKQKPVLTTPAMANEKGDQKEIAFRLNIPPSAEDGLYNGELTVIACAYKEHPEVLSVSSADNGGRVQSGWPALPDMVMVGNVNDGTRAAGSDMSSAIYEVTLAAPGRQAMQ